MKPTQPYQPLLFRILHGLTGLFAIAAMVTAFWTYDTYDGRWGRIPLPSYDAIEGIHGTFGLYTLLIFPAFVLYAFHRGYKRLIQPDFLAKLTRIGQPIWWYTLNRFTNTLALLALTFALFSGKMMDETWLPEGELNHAWYYAHLISWGIMVLAIALHLLINAKVGGTALLQSVLHWKFRDRDSPSLWSSHLAQWRSDFRLIKTRSSVSPLMVLEGAILISLIAAWILPLFK